jgi:hypothetical protein
MRGWRAAEKEGKLPSAAWQQERAWALRMGLTGSDSLEDKTIPTFARGELPHYAGINTFLKAPYIEDVDAGRALRRGGDRRPLSTAAPPTAPAPASGPRACARSPRSTRPTITRWASTCASR